MIIKAIKESNAMNQASNDIFMSFHEFVIVPLRTARAMYTALERFILNMFMITSCAANTTDGIPDIKNHPILQTPVKVAGVEQPMATAMDTLIGGRIDELADNNDGIYIGGLAENYNIIRRARNNRTRGIQFMGKNGPGAYQTLAIKALLQFVTNSGNLVKLNVSTTKRITLDLSEYQRVCEHLVANCKYMLDKFTGLVPTALIERASSVASQGIFGLEDVMLRKMFNKSNKGEKDRDLVCIDYLYKIMPVVSNMVFNQSVEADHLVEALILNSPTQLAQAVANGAAAQVSTSPMQAKPIIRDAFMLYSSTDKMFTTPPNITFSIAPLLFNPNSNVRIGAPCLSGIVQEFNSLVINYLNDLYDTQSRKIYTKTFANCAGSALVDALNGQSFPDFTTEVAAVGRVRPAPINNDNYYALPDTQVVLSSTIAYVMKIMSNRVNPVSGMKIHEIASLQEVSPDAMEKYRALIPMYLRIFNAFVERCKLQRKFIGNLTTTDAPAAFRFTVPAAALSPIVGDTSTSLQNDFVNQMTPLPLAAPNASTIKDKVCLYIDEVINGMNSLIQDVTAVHKELLETDSTVSLYFDTKRDFTKNFFTSNKEYPFAPLSIMAMGFRGDGAVPLYGTNITNNKFVYGLRSMLNDDFKLPASKVPYLKQLLTEFNGYTTKTNNIAESKFNDVLQYVSLACGFIYDLRFFNGRAISMYDMLAVAPTNLPGAGVAINPIETFQEQSTPSASLTLIESVNTIENRNKVANYVRDLVGAALAALPGNADSNPRSLVMMVNLQDLNVLPINVHSLMREVPLANIYNYAMTFDEIVANIELGPQTAAFQHLLQKPYSTITPTRQAVTLSNAQGETFANLSAANVRFVSDVLFNKIVALGGRAAAAAGQTGLTAAEVAQRVNSKLFRNLLFLSLIQFAIKNKVKSELDFINTKVVSNTNAVNNIITNTQDSVLATAANRNGNVTDDLFEF
jgi:hypothetical protein